jgi:hypothetical protein
VENSNALYATKKLITSYYRVDNRRNKKSRVFNIAICGNPNSCFIKIGNVRFRSLIDTGAEVSILSFRSDVM